MRNIPRFRFAGTISLHKKKASSGQFLFHVAATLLLLGTSSWADTTESTWSGSTSTSWSAPANWNNGVPSTTTSAEFNGTFTNQPTLGTSNATTQGLWVTGNGNTGVNGLTTIGGTGTLTITGDATLDGNANTGILLDGSGNNSLTINAPITLTNTTNFMVNNSGTLTVGGLSLSNGNYLTLSGTNTSGSVILSGAISGSGNLVANTSGNVTLSAANTFVGYLTVNAGTVTLSGNNTTSGITFVSGGTLVINAAGTSSSNSALGNSTLQIFGGTIDNRSGTGITLLTNNPIFIQQSFTFGGSNDLNLGTGTVSANLSSATITLNGSSKTLTLGGQLQNISPGGQSLTVNGTGNTLVLGGYGLNSYHSTDIGPASNIVDSIGGSANVVVTGLIFDGTPYTSRGGVSGGIVVSPQDAVFPLTTFVPSNNGLQYNGTAVLTLNGANTYSGGTTITSGAVLANNTSGSATGTGNVAVNNGATLGGSGAIAPASGNSITVASGGQIAPGTASVGSIAQNFLSITAPSSAAPVLTFNAPAGATLSIPQLSFNLGSGTAPTDSSGLTFAGSSSYIDLTTDIPGEVEFNNNLVQLNDLTNGQLRVNGDYLLFQGRSNSDYSGLTINSSGLITSGLYIFGPAANTDQLYAQNGDIYVQTNTSSGTSTDTPTLPQWGLLIMACLLIYVSTRTSHSPSKKHGTL